MDTTGARGSKALLVVAALAIPFASACGPDRITTSRRTVTTVQQPPPAVVTVPSMVDIRIENLRDEPHADPSQERVVGTIVNDGTKRVSGISIQVNALDRSGRVIRTITTPPLAQTIDPAGGRATFEASMPRDPAVAGYHAVAVAR